MYAGALTAIFIFVGIFALITVVLLGAVAFALNKITKQVDILTGKIDPIIVKTTDTLDTVNRVTMIVGEKADHILTRGETLTDNVSDRVEKTAGVVQNAVTTPLINLSGMIAGVTKGVSVWSRASKAGVNGTNASHGQEAKVKVYPTPDDPSI